MSTEKSNHNEQPVSNDSEKPKLKICCACPETKKKQRDLCVVERGESECSEEIEKHKVCLRAAGFNVT